MQDKRTPGTVVPASYEGEWTFTYYEAGYIKYDEDYSLTTYPSAAKAKRAMREKCGIEIPGEAG